MNTLKLILSICLTISLTKVSAQQVPFSSQYHANMITINPAMTGISEYGQAFLSHRSQYVGVQGGPQTSYFSIDNQIGDGKNGIGLTILNDVTDILARTSFMANYAYRVKFNEKSNLRFGLAMGLQNNRIDFDKAQVVDQNDQILFGPRQSQTVFNLDFGLALNLNKFQLGFALPQLVNSQPTFNSSTGEQFSINNQRHIRSTVKYEFVLNETKGVTFYPMVMVRATKGTPIQYDFSAVLDGKKAGWIGVTYHNSYAVAVSAGIRHRNFTFGYAHDFILSQVNAYSKFSSEFILGYKFGENLKKQKQWNDDMNIRVEDLVQAKEEQEEQIYYLEEKQDSISKELAIVRAENERVLREMDSVRADLKTQAEVIIAQTQNATTPAGYKPQTSNGKPQPSDGKYRIGDVTNYSDENNQYPAAGYYVIVGSFGVEKNALNFKDKLINNGMSDAALLFNTSKNVRNAYVFYSPNKSEVDAEKQKLKGKYDKIWILKLK